MSRQTEAEELFATHFDPAVRKEQLRWLTGPDSEGRDRIPVDLLAAQAVNESHWDMRPIIIRAMGDAAEANLAARPALVAALTSLLNERTMHPNDKAVVRETLDRLKEMA